jgi:hypothetical protein
MCNASSLWIVHVAQDRLTGIYDAIDPTRTRGRLAGRGAASRRASLTGEVAALHPLAVDAHALAHAVVAGGRRRRAGGDRCVAAMTRLDDRMAVAMMAPADHA